MKVSAKFLLATTLLFGLAAAGCGGFVGPVDQIATEPAVWIDVPLPASVYPPDPAKVLSHASSPNGISAFELSVDGEVVANNQAPPESTGDTLVQMTQAWIPAGLGTYQLSVRAIDGLGDFGPSTSVFITISDELEEEEDEEEEPTVTPTVVEPTVTPEEACVFEAAVNLFCRVGPHSDYAEVESFTPGVTALVVGESHAGDHWYVLGPNSGRPCTVPKGPRFGSTTGACSPQPQFTPPPLSHHTGNFDQRA